eukprot:CAMPEP_0198144500 /NCGR_PEP_ID=MMETSP1443-20131203/16393_1 /TAXON_ID=186043 /ORGANISM="Entomoneis sp., Strain CCMP2396" /LENGTH=369 /DNA_ID=CAMNT_0043807907 /DNA_START=262 /DNA_END=1371 /DNA_ORIENTATION=+
MAFVSPSLRSSPTSAFFQPTPSTTASSSSSTLQVATAVAVNGRGAVNGASSSSSSSNNNEHNHNTNIRLNVYEKARTVTSVCTSGTLCTSSAYEGIEGAPFGSFVDYVLDDDGNPVLLMNEMSMHTINVKEATAKKNNGNPALVSLFTQLGGTASNSDSAKSLQDVSRVSLTGTLEKIDPQTAPDMDAIRMRYSIKHVYADQVMDSPKFAFYRFLPQKIYFVGGFGVLAKWVDPMDYKLANPDILATEAADIVQRCNREHVEDFLLTAEHLLNIQTEIQKIRMTNVDRLGMDIRVTSYLGSRRNKLQTDEYRIGFRIPVISVEDAKSEILKVFQEAWEKGNGYQWGDANDDDENEDAVPIMKIASDSLE